MSKIDKAIDAAINDIAECTYMEPGETWLGLKERLYQYFSDIKPQPVEVTEDVAEQFDDWHKRGVTLMAILAGLTSYGSYPLKSWFYSIHHGDYDVSEKTVARIFLGDYVVVKPKRYVLPMPETQHMSMNRPLQSYVLFVDGKWLPREYNSERDAELAYGGIVTQADIDAAPDWVKSIEPVEVSDDEK